MLIHIQVALAMADGEQMASVASKCNPHEFTNTLAIFYTGIMLTGEYEHSEAFGIAFTNAALKYGILLSYDEAVEMRYELLRGDPEGVEWGRMITMQAERDGYLINKAGYRRWLSRNDMRETVCRNTPIQGLASAIGKEGIIRYGQWIEDGPGFDNVRLLSYVHDELNSVAKNEWAEQALEAKLSCMSEAGNIYMNDLGVECRAEGYINSHWKK